MPSVAGSKGQVWLGQNNFSLPVFLESSLQCGFFGSLQMWLWLCRVIYRRGLF